MDQLDCGRGLGTITTGLVAIVSPEKTVGVDLDQGQITRTQRDN